MTDTDLLTDDELDLGEEERRRKAQPEAIGTPIEPSHFSSNEPLAESAPPKADSIGAPLQLQTPHAQRPAYQHYQELAGQQPKPWHDLGTGGKIGRVAESIGTAINPNIVAAIPGTEQHHHVQVGRARNAAEEENREIASRGEEELRGAQTEEQRALAKKNANPVEKVGQTPEEVTLHDLMTGNNGGPRINPKTGKPYMYMEAYQEVMGAKAGVKPDKISTKEDLQHRIAVAQEAGRMEEVKALQKELQAIENPQQGSWMPLYDEKGNVTGAWNATTGEHRSSTAGGPGKTSQGSHIATTADAAMEKKVAPLRGVIEEADKAAALKDAADKGNAEADVDLALTFFKTMRSATGGGSGIRFTQQENNLIMGARNLWGGLEVRGNKIFSNGEPLSRDQRQQIFEVIQIHRAGAQRQLDEMKQGGGATPTTEAAVPSGGFAKWKQSQKP